MYLNLGILATFVFFYSIGSARLARSPINGALVFAAFGFAFGPLGLGVLDLDINTDVLSALAEMTLALVLFTDAANANLGVLRKSFRIPQRLLLIGLPLTILLGFGVGMSIFDNLSWVEIAILATMLAPTDAALGKAVVSDTSVPSNIREGLNVESGLNDGICVPILFIFLAITAGSTADGGTQMIAVKLVVQEIGIGILTGILITFLGGRLLGFAIDHNWVDGTWRQSPVIALAFVCFAVAQYFGGSGFIAAFAGGLLFGKIIKDNKQALLFSAEGAGDIFALLTWVVFGAAIIGQASANFSWEIVLYSILSLSLVRMLPVFLSLTGTGLRTDEKLFMGWFGPRGLASIVFAVIVLNQKLPGGDTITMTVVCTIVMSIIAHGLSASPLVAVLAKRETTKKSANQAEQ